MRRKTPEAIARTDRPSTVRWAAILLAGLGLLATARVGTAEVINRIVLRVNDRIATLEDYELRRAQLTDELLRQEMPSEERRRAMEELGERVFRDLFEDLLLQSRADQLEVRISDDRINSVIEQIRQDMGIPDNAALEAALQQSGFTLEEFKENWRQNLRVQEVIEREVRMPIQEDLSEDDLRRYYRAHRDDFMTPAQVQVREVVILEDSPLTAEERLALAEGIRAAIEAGEAIEERIDAYAGEGKTSKIIDLGWVEAGELSADLEAEVFNLPAGSCSRPLVARGGLHVMEVLDRKDPELQPFEEVVNRIRATEGQRLSAERVPAYMEDLEKSSYIKIDPPTDAQGFRAVKGSVVEELEEVPAELVPNEASGENPAGSGAPAPAEPSAVPPL